MNVSRFILLLLRCIISLIEESMMDEYEISGDFDENGIPLSSEWRTQRFMLNALRDCVREIENGFKDEDENENS